MAISIVALRGAAGFVVQARLAAFAKARAAEGLRVAGCVEEFSGSEGAGCAGRALRDVATGRRRLIGQELGSGSLACHLDAEGVTQACQDALEAIDRGCDLLILAKFGKLEAARSGLVDAFAAAVERHIPIVTSVAPQFADLWDVYSGGLATYAEPSRTVLESWWLGLRGSHSAPSLLRAAM
ncbi:MAG: hypothetical protein DI565_04605 [Ancylobacter novellus]|uniref:DUF2478 domain-containing protein n=1 Tax=Ancylobacter novellus TaxID=921 RepID=A0A2W5MWE6_ANCNO|nr:MAG: hypothetical protein DI565_04605 [Ancylobacter novellus]